MAQTDETMWVVLTLDIQPGREEAFEKFFLDMRAQVKAQEPGTLRFDMFWVDDAPGRCMMIEQYADQAAWNEHSRLQGERGVVPQTMEYTAGPPDFRFLKAIAGQR